MYVHNNPLIYHDPTGQSLKSIFTLENFENGLSKVGNRMYDDAEYFVVGLVDFGNDALNVVGVGSGVRATGTYIVKNGKSIWVATKSGAKSATKTITSWLGKSNVPKSLLNVETKADALKSIGNLPSNVQSSTKSFFKGGSNAYTDFTVELMPNGNYMAKMTKPGNVPGSKAVYYKEISSDGTTLKVYKETYDPQGFLVHSKDK